MQEKIYWAVAALLALVIIYTGVTLYPPLLAGFHTLVCILLVLVVLLQSGRAADLAGAFGGAGSQTAFGPRGAATLLSKATTFLAVVFMFTSLTLAIFASSPRASSLAEEAATPASESTTPAPAEEESTQEAPAQQEAPPAPSPSPQE